MEKTNVKEIITNNCDETFAAGEVLAAKARSGDIYCLSGDLGAGKTAFSQGFAKGLGIKDDITSPTFTIMNVYEDGRLPLYHFDVYRLSDGSELEAIGAEEYFFGEGVCIIEWPENIEGFIPENAVWIRIDKDADKGADYRKITIKIKGDKL